MTEKFTQNHEAKKSWDMILYSFLFSQGNRFQQMLIIEHLIFHDLWKPNSGLFDQKTDSLQDLVSTQIGRYVYALDKRNAHETLKFDEGATPANLNFETQALLEDVVLPMLLKRESLKSKWFEKLRIKYHIKFGKEFLPALMVTRDRMYIDETMSDKDLTYKNGRPVSKESGRDKYSSFVIDFGVLKQGDGLYKWGNLPEEYKVFWDSVIHELEKQISKNKNTLKSVQSLVKAYLEKHPDLSVEDRKKIIQFARI